MKTKSKTRLVILNVKFLSTTLIGTASVSLGFSFATPAVQLAVLGSMLSTLAGLFVAYLDQEKLREKRRNKILENLGVPISLAPEPEFLGAYFSYSEALGKLAKQTDPTLRECALAKLALITGDVQSLSEGIVEFTGTETWRTVYEELLRSELKSYYSVAWVKTKDYWQDVPGYQSMELNYEFVSSGKRLERIVILRAHLWPKNSPLPTGAILPWITEQHERGIRVSLVRESDLETELLGDFGIYDNRATGVQELDDNCRTVWFSIRFDEKSLKLARARFERISLYGTPFSKLLDRVATAA